MNRPSLILEPLRAALIADHANRVDLLIRIGAPAELPTAPARPPLVLSSCSGR